MTSCTVGPDRVHYISAHKTRLILSVPLVISSLIKTFTEHDSTGFPLTLHVFLILALRRKIGINTRSSYQK